MKILTVLKQIGPFEISFAFDYFFKEMIHAYKDILIYMYVRKKSVRKSISNILCTLLKYTLIV